MTAEPHRHPHRVMIEVTSKFHCGTCDNQDCDWWKERDQISRINTMVNREYVNHFSMRLATEMSGCRCHSTAKSEQEIREKAPDKLCKICPFLERPYMGEQVDTYIYTKELQDALKLFRSKQGEQR